MSVLRGRDSHFSAALGRSVPANGTPEKEKKFLPEGVKESSKFEKKMG